jgi:hypothetical protein
LFSFFLAWLGKAFALFALRKRQPSPVELVGLGILWLSFHHRESEGCLFRGAKSARALPSNALSKKKPRLPFSQSDKRESLAEHDDVIRQKPDGYITAIY